MSLYCKIKKRFPGFQLDVSFETDNHVLALMGASGCGKSMTLRCIAGIEKPDEGKIILNGKTLFDSEQKINLPPQKRKVGILFQDYALFPNMTVAQNIQTGLSNRNSKKVEELISQYHLEGLSSHYPHQLSGGQKQRCALARMMASQPDIIMLDEPFSALDGYLKWQLEQEMIQEIQKYSKTVLLVSHDSHEVYHMSDYVVTMHQGHNNPLRAKKDLYSHPLTYQEALLIGCKNVFPAIFQDDQVHIPDLGISFSGQHQVDSSLSYIGIPEKGILPTYLITEPEHDIIAKYSILSKIEEQEHDIYVIQLEHSTAVIYWKVSKAVSESLATKPDQIGINIDNLYYLYS